MLGESEHAEVSHVSDTEDTQPWKFPGLKYSILGKF